jgi:hypothetical protein
VTVSSKRLLPGDGPVRSARLRDRRRREGEDHPPAGQRKRPLPYPSCQPSAQVRNNDALLMAQTDDVAAHLENLEEILSHLQAKGSRSIMPNGLQRDLEHMRSRYA